MVPVLSRAQSRPCPPPSLVVNGGDGVNTGCNAPQWFAEMEDFTWSTPAQNTCNDVKPSPLPPGAEGQTGVTDDWTGGAADQETGEFLLPAQGGHNGYYGNEVYALALREEAPSWRRVWGPSTNGSILTNDPGFNSKGDYLDGQPRPVHGWNRPCCSSDGRIWLAGLDGMGSPSGHWSTACWSFSNRSRTGWTYHGLGVPEPPAPFGSAFSWQGGPAAYDRVGGRVWSAAQYAVSDGGYSVDVTTNSIERHNWNLPGNPFGAAWSVIAHDLRVWIVGSVNESRLWILDLENVAAGWRQRGTTGAPNAFDYGAGAAYHQPSRAILCWQDTYGASIRKLSVPSDPLNGVYTWSTITPAVNNAVTPAANPRYPGRTFSKFQMIEDMGNGQAALCTVNDTLGAAFVFKLPPIV